MNYDDIPKFSRAKYAVDVSWGYLEEWLANLDSYGNLDLDPKFQRVHVWDEDKRRRYVEFALREGQSGKDLYMNQHGFNKGNISNPLVMVDGKQRLEAVRMFLRDELVVFGYTRSQFETRVPPLSGPGFKIHINDLATEAEVLQWYLDLNDGGVVHTSAELNKVRDMLEALK